MQTKKRIREVLALFVSGAMLAGQELKPSDHPVVVTPGTPSVWSMEQAHYLLNRLRAHNDSLTVTAPDPAALDPNATNGIRLDSLQQVLNISAAYDQANSIQNTANLSQYQQATARRAALTQQMDTLQNNLYQDQLSLAKLQGEQTSLQAVTTPTDKTQNRLAEIGGQITALTAKNTATSNQITALNGQIGQAATLTLTDTQVSAPPGAPTPILSSAVNTLINKAANNFDSPKLAASIVLDNFLQMQYEIVAKQLTLLRDDTGVGQRVIFLEMPTSIESADHRLWGGGGQDKLAQSWWRVNRIYRQYKTQTSPCWEEEDFSPEGHSIDVVAENTEVDSKPVTRTGRPKRSAPDSAIANALLDITALNNAYTALINKFDSLTRQRRRGQPEGYLRILTMRPI